MLEKETPAHSPFFSSSTPPSPPPTLSLPSLPLPSLLPSLDSIPHLSELFVLKPFPVRTHSSWGSWAK